MAEMEKEVVKAGRSIGNLALWGLSLVAVGALVFTGMNWAARRAEKKGKLA